MTVSEAAHPDTTPYQEQDLSVLLGLMTAQADRERERADSLAIAVESNRTIGAALGLIMAQHNLDEGGAFAVLVRLSQENNCKMRVLAAKLVALHVAGVSAMQDPDLASTVST